MEKEQFGKLLTALRKKQGISQKELAETLSVSTSAVSKWEHGKNLPDMTMLNRIAEIFQVSCDALHNPEKTLVKLTSAESETEVEKRGEEVKEDTKEEKAVALNPETKRHKVIGKIVILAGVVAIAVGIYLFYLSQREPTIQQVGTRYINDSAWGNVYEVAVVVDGKISLELQVAYLEEIEKMFMQNQELETETIKVSFYDNEKAALAWEETEFGGYVFLDVE